MKNIQRASRFFKWVFIITFIVMPILQVWFWTHMPHIVPATMSPRGFEFSVNEIPEGIKILYPLSTNLKIFGFLISMIPLTINLCLTYFLIRLFQAYEQYQIFAVRSIRYLKKIGYMLFVGQLVHPIYQALLSTALTWNNPSGKRAITLGFSGVNLGVLLAALLVILISWIMAEGQKMHEEQKFTV